MPWLHLCHRTSCKTLKSPFPTGMANTMDNSSPSNFCHFTTVVQSLEGAKESISSKSRRTLCEGRWMVMVSVSNCHTNIKFLVAQVSSPFNIFLIEAGSCR
jgi:hypothetical protein